MKHRTLALLLAAAILAALPACAGNDGGEVPDESPAVTEPAGPDDSEPAQSDGPAVDGGEPEDTSEPSGEPSEQPSDEIESLPPVEGGSPALSPDPGEVNQPAASPSTTPSQTPAPSPSVQPSPEPSLSPEPSPEVSPEPSPEASPSGSVDLQAFYESLTENENFVANMPLEGEFLTAYYPGLSDIATKQQIICMPMISAVVCEIALVEVENAADVQAVKDIFQARIDSQVGTDENPGLACYPASIEGWKNDSRIVSNGNCIMMIAWWEGNCDTAVTAFNALF